MFSARLLPSFKRTAFTQSKRLSSQLSVGPDTQNSLM